MGRIFERPRKVCGGSNLSTDLLLWGIYIKKCISPVRIRLRVKKPRNASTKFRKTSESKKAEKSLEISAFFVFSCLHLNQTRIMCLQVILDAEFVLSNLDAAQWYTSPLVKQGLASDRDLPGLQNHVCKRAYVYGPRQVKTITRFLASIPALVYGFEYFVWLLQHILPQGGSVFLHTLRIPMIQHH